MEIKPFIKQTDEGVMEFFEHSGGMLLESRGVNRVYNRKRIVASNPALRIRGSGEYFVIESESKLGNKLLTLFSEDDFYYAAELEKTETSLTGKVKRNFDPNVDEHERVKMPHTGTAIQTIIDKFEKYLGADDYLGLFGAIAYDFARNFYDVGERFSEGSDDFNLMLPSKLLKR